MSKIDRLLEQHFSKERKREYELSTNIYFRECQNIIGEPPKPWTDDVKCNKDTLHGEPYCPECEKGMHQKAWPRSKKQ